MLKKSLSSLFILAFCSVQFFCTELSAGDLPGGFHFDQPTCFQRVYSVKHLKKHPKQRVTMIRLEHFPKRWGLLLDEGSEADPRAAPDRVFFRILVKTRKSKWVGNNSGECTQKGDVLQCHLECDGGGFKLVREKENSILIRNQGFVVSGCDGEPEDNSIWVNPKPDDKAFRLYLLPQSKCKQPLTTE